MKAMKTDALWIHLHWLLVLAEQGFYPRGVETPRWRFAEVAHGEWRTGRGADSGQFRHQQQRIDMRHGATGTGPSPCCRTLAPATCSHAARCARCCPAGAPLTPLRKHCGSSDPTRHRCRALCRRLTAALGATAPASFRPAGWCGYRGRCAD